MSHQSSRRSIRDADRLAAVLCELKAVLECYDLLLRNAGDADVLMGVAQWAQRLIRRLERFTT